jgi:hypothetical protein
MAVQAAMLYKNLRMFDAGRPQPQISSTETPQFGRFIYGYHNVIIHGPYHSGKTSLLLDIEAKLQM